MKATKLRKISNPPFAICVENSECPVALELHKTYRMLPDKEAAQEGYLRIIDESGEDYLYPADYFVIVTVPREKARALSQSMKTAHAGGTR